MQDPQTVIVGGPLNDNPIGVAMKLDAQDLTRFVNGVLNAVARGRESAADAQTP